MKGGGAHSSDTPFEETWYNTKARYKKTTMKQVGVVEHKFIEEGWSRYTKPTWNLLGAEVGHH